MTGPSAPQPARTRRVLIVDDEPELAADLAEILEAVLDDVVVVSCASGAEALAVMAAGPVDLIISDFCMDDLDGLAFLERARALAPDVPAILVTGYGDLDLAVQALNERGVQNFLEKPFDMDEMLALVEALLRLGGRAEHGAGRAPHTAPGPR